MNYSDILLNFDLNKNIFDVDDKEYVYHFNEPIDLVNLNKTNIRFVTVFNHPVNNKLPKVLKILTFGDNFNQNIDYLPSTLNKLTCGYKFNQPINNLPHALTFLHLCGNFNQQLDLLPESLEILDIKFLTKKISINDLPASIKKIIVNSDYVNNINSIYHNKLDIYISPKRITK